MTSSDPVQPIRNHYRGNAHRTEKEILLHFFLFPHVSGEKLQPLGRKHDDDPDFNTTLRLVVHDGVGVFGFVSRLFTASERNGRQTDLTLLLSFQVCFCRLQWRMSACGRWFHGSDPFTHYINGDWSCVLSSLDVNLFLFIYFSELMCCAVVLFF